MTKSCAVIVWFFEDESNRVETKLLDLVDVHEESEGENLSTGTSLFEKMRNRIPVKHFIDFAADRAANMG